MSRTFGPGLDTPLCITGPLRHNEKGGLGKLQVGGLWDVSEGAELLHSASERISQTAPRASLQQEPLELAGRTCPAQLFSPQGFRVPGVQVSMWNNCMVGFPPRFCFYGSKGLKMYPFSNRPGMALFKPPAGHKPLQLNLKAHWLLVCDSYKDRGEHRLLWKQGE